MRAGTPQGQSLDVTDTSCAKRIVDCVNEVGVPTANFARAPTRGVRYFDSGVIPAPLSIRRKSITCCSLMS